MSNRTTASKVEAILGRNYIPNVDLSPYIDVANAVISRMNTCAVSKGYTLTTSELALIETWYAAWVYTDMDPLYRSKSTGGASGSFESDPKSKRYLRQAIALDPSGCLAGIVSGHTAGAVWLGKVPSERIPYNQRD
jgi:hypothetical protein